MTLKELKRLNLGSRVRWVPDNSEGEVVEAGYAGIKVRWSDGGHGIFYFGHGTTGEDDATRAQDVVMA